MIVVLFANAFELIGSYGDLYEGFTGYDIDLLYLTESNFMFMIYYITLFVLIFSVSFHLSLIILFIVFIIMIVFYPH